MPEGEEFELEAAKSFQSLRIVGNMVGEEFEGYEATKIDILGLVDDSHPATAEFLDDAVMRDRLADHWCEILCLGAAQVNEDEEVG